MKLLITIALLVTGTASTAKADDGSYLGCTIDYMLRSVKDGKNLLSERQQTEQLAVKVNSSSESAKTTTFKLARDIEVDVKIINSSSEKDNPTIYITIVGQEDEVELYSDYLSNSETYFDYDFSSIYVDGQLLDFNVECED